MKKINKYISMVALSALAMAFNACTDECEREASPVQTDGLTAYIDFNTLTSLEFLPDDEQAFEVKIGRQLATETATVHITAEGEKFNVPQTVEFAAGETEKTVKITFDIAIGTSASVKIGIEESETYIYGLTEQTIKVSRDYTWVSAGSLTFSDATFTGAEEELAVEKAKEGNNLYRIIEPYCEEGAGIHVQFTLDDNNNAARGVGADGETRGRSKRYPFPIAEHESCSYRSHHHLQVGGNEQDLFLPFGTTLVRQPHYAGGRCADGDHLQDARSQVTIEDVCFNCIFDSNLYLFYSAYE